MTQQIKLLLLKKNSKDKRRNHQPDGMPQKPYKMLHQTVFELKKKKKEDNPHNQPHTLLSKR